MNNHGCGECIACNEYSADLRQCTTCEEDVCETCWHAHDKAHYYGPAMFEAFQKGDMARVRRLIHAVHGTTPELVPFSGNPITTEETSDV